MLRRHVFTLFTLAAIAALAWGSRQLDRIREAEGAVLPSPAGELDLAPAVVARRELLETLDRIVAYQGYYRSVYGHYTKILGRLGVSLPPAVQEHYDVRVQQASSDRFLVVAASESRGRIEDFVSVDHLYRVQANFRLPAPRPEFLRAHADRQLRALLQAGDPERFHESGVFRGYFRYELRPDSQGGRVAQALGIAAPVEGIELEQRPGEVAASSVPTQPGTWGAVAGSGSGHSGPETGVAGASGAARTGEQGGRNLLGALEEVYLAQRIFRGETGRYARTWSELARIANFRFEQKEALAREEGGVPFADGGSTLDLEVVSDRRPAQHQDPLAAGAVTPLIIEPLGDAEPIH